MTYQEGMAALQLVAEEEIGVHLRAQARKEQVRSDRTMDALRREQLERI